MNNRSINLGKIVFALCVAFLICILIPGSLVVAMDDGDNGTAYLFESYAVNSSGLILTGLVVVHALFGAAICLWGLRKKKNLWILIWFFNAVNLYLIYLCGSIQDALRSQKNGAWFSFVPPILCILIMATSLVDWITRRISKV